MKVLVTGASGFIGRRVVRVLRDAGHRVDATSRNPDRARDTLGDVDAIHRWRPGDEPIPADAVRAADAVVHLLGESVAGYWTAAKKRRIRDSRVIGTRNLVAGIEALSPDERPDALVTASAIGYYGDRGAERLTEASPAGHDFLAEVCAAWEDEAHRAEGLGLRVAALRTGLVLGDGGGLLGVMVPVWKLGLGGPMGSGEQYWPWVHVDDVAGLYRWTLEAGLSGPINAVGPEPVTQAAFAKALGRAVNRPAFFPVPAFLLRLVLGEFSSESLSSHRVMPARAVAEGYAFEHPDLAEALASIV